MIVIQFYILILFLEEPCCCFFLFPSVGFAFCSRLNKKLIGDSDFVIFLMNCMFKDAIGCPSSSLSSSVHRFSPVSAGKEATTRRTPYFPRSVLRPGRDSSELRVCVTRSGSVVGECALPLYGKSHQYKGPSNSRLWYLTLSMKNFPGVTLPIAWRRYDLESIPFFPVEYFA